MFSLDKVTQSQIFLDLIKSLRPSGPDCARYAFAEAVAFHPAPDEPMRLSYAIDGVVYPHTFKGKWVQVDPTELFSVCDDQTVTLGLKMAHLKRRGGIWTNAPDSVVLVDRLPTIQLPENLIDAL